MKKSENKAGAEKAEKGAETITGWSNYHTHTVFCDGTDTPEELVVEAIRLGCPEIGFSGHSFTEFDQSYCMSKERTLQYKKTIRALQRKYEGSIRILLGIEQDYYSGEPTDDYDYIIGSVHYVLKDGVYLPVDESRELFTENISKYYSGDVYAFVEDYYQTVAGIYEKTKCAIIGHFDLVTKFNENNFLFDTAHPRYVKAAEKALYSLMKVPAIFELNTGAMARGYRSVPYPEPFLLKQLQQSGAEVIISSDCHAKAGLLFGFNEIAENREWRKHIRHTL